MGRAGGGPGHAWTAPEGTRVPGCARAVRGSCGSERWGLGSCTRVGCAWWGWGRVWVRVTRGLSCRLSRTRAGCGRGGARKSQGRGGCVCVEGLRDCGRCEPRVGCALSGAGGSATPQHPAPPRGTQTGRGGPFSLTWRPEPLAPGSQPPPACKSFAFTIPPLAHYHTNFMFGAGGGHKAGPVSGAGMPAWQTGCEEEGEAGRTLPQAPQTGR